MMGLPVIVSVIVTALLQGTAPPARVLVVGTGESPVPVAFVEALRIQVIARAEVVEGPPLKATLLGDRFEEASRLVEAEHAVLAVWIEQAARQDHEVLDFVVYAVGRQPHRALIEVARVRADEAPDTDRVLALKVGAFLDSILTTGGSEVDLARSFGQTALPPETARPVLHLAFVGEVGGIVTLATPAGVFQEGIGVAAGARLAGARRAGEAYAAFRLPTDANAAGAAGRLAVRERLLVGGARVLFFREPSRAPLAFGAFLEAGVRFLDGEATAPGGGRGSADRTVALAVTGGELRIGLGRTLALRLFAGLEVDAVRQTFSIDDVRVYDMGHVRPTAGLSFVFALP
jgi:hypothetical protein